MGLAAWAVCWMACVASVPAAEDGWVEEPVVVPVDPALARGSAALAVLGGAGAPGPLLLGSVPLAAVAAAWSQEQAEPGGHLPRAALAAAGAAAGREAVLLLTAGPVAAAGVALVAAGGTALGLGVLGLAWQPAGVNATALRASGALGALLLAAVVLAVPPLLATSVALARAAGVRGGQVLWRGLPAGGTAIAWRRPLSASATWLLVSAAAAGRMEREGWKDALPLAGPFWSWWSARGGVSRAAWNARQVAEVGRGWGSFQRRLDVTLVARALLFLVAWSALPVLALGLGGVALGMAGSAVAPGTLGRVLAGGSVVGLGGVALVGMGALLAAGSAGVLGWVAPGLVGGWTVQSWEAPELRSLRQSGA